MPGCWSGRGSTASTGKRLQHSKIRGVEASAAEPGSCLPRELYDAYAKLDPNFPYYVNSSWQRSPTPGSSNRERSNVRKRLRPRPATTDDRAVIACGQVFSPQVPEMPHVDTHITNEEVKWENLISSIHRARTAHSPLQHGGHAHHDEERPTEKPGEANEGEEAACLFSESDIRKLLRYIDSSMGNRDGRVDYRELQEAFRRVRRVRAAEPFEKEGRRLIARLESILELRALTVGKFFDRLDVNRGGKGDNKVSLNELRTGLTRLTEEEDMRLLRFNEKELMTLLRYMDPNADGVLEPYEVRDAFRRAHVPPSVLEEQHVIGKILHVLDKVALESRRKRLIDLFREIDKDGDGELSLDELQGVLRRLLGPPPEVRARCKIRAQKAVENARRAEVQRKFVEHLKVKFRAAKESGALPVLLRLEQWLHERKLRIRDIFSKAGFDKSGDGMVDQYEFHQALERLNINVPKREVTSIVNFLDQNGNMMIESDELDAALRDLNQAKALLLHTSKKKQPRARVFSPVHKRMPLSDLSMDRTGLQHMIPLRRDSGVCASARGKVYPGDMLDIAWLNSYDRHLDTHYRKLVTSTL